MATINEKRTPAELEELTVIVLGTDRFLSGWGGAEGGMSYAGWACRPEDLDAVEEWVEARGDMKRVRVVTNDYRPGPGCAHLTIYPVRPGHPALEEGDTA